MQVFAEHEKHFNAVVGVGGLHTTVAEHLLNIDLPVGFRQRVHSCRDAFHSEESQGCALFGALRHGCHLIDQRNDPVDFRSAVGIDCRQTAHYVELDRARGSASGRGEKTFAGDCSVGVSGKIEKVVKDRHTVACCCGPGKNLLKTVGYMPVSFRFGL